MIEVGKSVVHTVDDYIDGKIDYSAARKKIDGLSDKIDGILENEEKDKYGTVINSSDFSVSTKTLSISLSLLGESTGHATYDELLTDRNELAEIVGMKKRK